YKCMVIAIKAAGFCSWRRWKLPVFTLEFWKVSSQQIDIQGAVHINAHWLTRSIPHRFRQALSIRNRLIEVHRCHMEAMPFPGRKYLLKFRAVQATRHDRRNELRKFQYVDVFPHHSKLVQNHTKELLKVCTTEANGKHRRNKTGKLCHVDVPAQRFVCDLA